MKFSQYVARINRLYAQHPEAHSFDVVTSKDDEGNGFVKVYYEPSIGYMTPNMESYSTKPEDKDRVNVVCLN